MIAASSFWESVTNNGVSESGLCHLGLLCACRVAASVHSGPIEASTETGRLRSSVWEQTNGWDLLILYKAKDAPIDQKASHSERTSSIRLFWGMGSVRGG